MPIVNQCLAPQREGFAIAFATLVCSGMANGDVFMSPVVTRKCIEDVVVIRHFDLYMAVEEARSAGGVRASQHLFCLVSPNYGVCLSTKDQTCVSEQLIIFYLCC